MKRSLNRYTSTNWFRAKLSILRQYNSERQYRNGTLLTSDLSSSEKWQNHYSCLSEALFLFTEVHLSLWIYLNPLSPGNKKSKDSLPLQLMLTFFSFPQMNWNFIVLVGKERGKRGEVKEEIKKSSVL